MVSFPGSHVWSGNETYPSLSPTSYLSILLPPLYLPQAHLLLPRFSPSSLHHWRSTVLPQLLHAFTTSVWEWALGLGMSLSVWEWECSWQPSSSGVCVCASPKTCSLCSQRAAEDLFSNQYADCWSDIPSSSHLPQLHSKHKTTVTLSGLAKYACSHS